MPYNRQMPDAPISGSMLPRAKELTLDDILVLTQPGNPIGQKNKSLTLQVLAAFLGDKFNSIVLQGSDGKSLTLTGNGTTFDKPHTSQIDMRDYTIVESDDGITLQVASPNVTQKVVLGYTTSEISSTANGLTQKLTLARNGITFSNQALVDGQVVTTEKQISPAHIDTQELEFFNTNFPGQGWKIGIANSPDPNMKELVLQFTGTEAEKRFVVRAETLFTQPAKFGKDVTINADVTVEKSLKLDGTLPVLENKKGATNVNSLYFQSAATPDSNSTLQFCSALSISGGSYTLPNHGAAASNLGHLKIIANDTSSSVQVYFRSSLSVTLAPGQAAQFLWGGGDYGWFRF